MIFRESLEWYATIRITTKDISQTIEETLLNNGLRKPYFNFFNSKTFSGNGVKVVYSVDYQSERGATKIEITANSLERAKDVYAPLEKLCSERQSKDLKKIGLQIKRNKEKFK